MHAPAKRTTTGQHAGHIRNATEKICASSNIRSRCGDVGAVTHEGLTSMKPHSTMLFMGAPMSWWNATPVPVPQKSNSAYTSVLRLDS